VDSKLESIMINSERYHRQLILKDFGEAAQQKLLNAKVLVVGAGGLGCPALQYLTAAGVGTIGVVDHDVVSLSNLHRQVLYSVMDIGESKAQKAIEILTRLNPEVNFQCYDVQLTAQNAADIISPFDIVLDGSDNFATRYLLNDVCVLLNKRIVYGAVSQYEGQLAIFNCKTDAAKTPVNYRDLFPDPPMEGEVLNCEEAGVLGVLPGIIGTMMANETIKLVTGIGQVAVDRLITYDSRNNQLYEIELMSKKETASMIPPDLDSLRNMDYDFLCSANSQLEIDIDLFNELMQSERATIIDVRERDEVPRIDQFEHLHIPIAEFQNPNGVLNSDTIVLFCQSGKRSLRAAQQLSKIYGENKKIYSLNGGIMEWLIKLRETV